MTTRLVLLVVTGLSMCEHGVRAIVSCRVVLGLKLLVILRQWLSRTRGLPMLCTLTWPLVMAVLVMVPPSFRYLVPSSLDLSLLAGSCRADTIGAWLPTKHPKGPMAPGS